MSKDFKEVVVAIEALVRELEQEVEEGGASAEALLYVRLWNALDSYKKGQKLSDL